MASEHALCIQARQRNPMRLSGNDRNWSHIGVNSLNPVCSFVKNSVAADSCMIEATSALTLSVQSSYD
jgi:hypothetical protein